MGRLWKSAGKSDVDSLRHRLTPLSLVNHRSSYPLAVWSSFSLAVKCRIPSFDLSVGACITV